MLMDNGQPDGQPQNTMPSTWDC